MCRIKILIASHKKYDYPDGNIYYPIQVGAEGAVEKLNILSDNEGESISDRNFSYCELTALYWAWKNDFFGDAEYCGLVHYRRYFSGAKNFTGSKILSEHQISRYMAKYDIILPKYCYFYTKNIESNYSECHYEKDLQLALKVLVTNFPDYLDVIENFKKQKKMHAFNMFIMRKELFNEYCEWLFFILFKLEDQIDISSYSQNQARVFGYLSERLLNIWVTYKKLKIKTVHVINIEENNSFNIRWKRKIRHFRKITKSFIFSYFVK